MTCCSNYAFVYDILRSTFTFQQTFLLFSTVTLFRLLVFSIGQLFVVCLDNGTNIERTWIHYFYSISIEYLYNWLFWGKCLCKRSRNCFAIFVDTAWLSGGLNDMMFICLLRLLLFLCTRLYLKSKFLYPLFLNAVSYFIFDARKISAF